MRNIKHKKTIIIVSVIGVLLFGSVAVWFVLKKHDPTEAIVAATTPTVAPKQETPPTQNTLVEPPKTTTPTPPPVSQWPVLITGTDAASLIVVVNKKHQLPSSYVPAGLTAYGGGQLRAPAVEALNKLITDASASGHSLKIISSYRSYSSQQSVYNSYVARDGQAAADTYSARPGFSEHQTGLAADVGNGSCDLEICFGDTPAGKWIALNAQNYGFIVRYPQGKESQTGYQYEPWHLRYVGTDVSQSVYASGKTLDQYYNVPAGGYQ